MPSTKNVLINRMGESYIPVPTSMACPVCGRPSAQGMYHCSQDCLSITTLRATRLLLAALGDAEPRRKRGSTRGRRGAKC